MEESGKLEIDIKTPEKSFTAHLELENNDRIIFSGMFGTGKTYFLDRYFNNEKYNTIHLFPVNYEIASNEDIFKLIKYDILYSLIVEKEYEISNDLVDTAIDEYDLFGFAQYNIGFIIAYLAHFIPKIGKATSNFLEKTKKLWDKYRNAKIEYEKNESAFYQFSNFVQNTEKHYLFENDFVIQFIEDALIKKNEEGKESILIIDDLDRIDPEHIFRLLNIFAAHLDSNTEQKNKFGFNKIILVLDIDNVRNIFHAKYGSDTDFSGYIDKFYSYEVYNYDNTKAIEANVNEILLGSKIVIGSETLESVDIEMFNRLISLFVRCNVLNLRMLLKMNNTSFRLMIPDFEIQRKVYARNIYTFKFLYYLQFLFGNYSIMLRALKSNKFDFVLSYNENDEWLIGQILVPLDYKRHAFEIDKNQCFADKELDIRIEYVLRQERKKREYFVEIKRITNIKGEVIQMRVNHLFNLLIQSLNQLNKLVVAK